MASLSAYGQDPSSPAVGIPGANGINNSHAMIKAPVATKRRTDEPVFSFAVVTALICISMINDAFVAAARALQCRFSLVSFEQSNWRQRSARSSLSKTKPNAIFECAQAGRPQLDP
jgi:hypothetical protein